MGTVSDVKNAMNGNKLTKKSPDALKSLLESADYKKRFEEVLGKKAPAFTSSILAAVNINPQLKDCDPISVISSAMVAATLDLPINQSLGFAHLVPYGKVCQFQMGWRGYVQLAQRTGLFKIINADVVYDGEFLDHDRLSGEIIIDGNKRKSDVVIGYFAHFELLNGFRKTVYFTKSDAEKHGKKYSKLFQQGKGSWVTNFDAMCIKTPIKMLLGKWAPLSTDYQMQRALQLDQAVFDVNGKATYGDNPDNVINLDPSLTEEIKLTPEEQEEVDKLAKENKKE